MELDKIPGYPEAMAAAQAEEEELRDLAFIPVDLDICGVPVRQLTARHLLLCIYVRSPFFFSRDDLGPEHVAQFLWIVSPQFDPLDGLARSAFIKNIATSVQFAEAVPAIDDYLDQALMDRPPSGAARGASITSFIASLVDEFASEYGWTIDEILDRPLAALYQLLRRMERRRDPKAVTFNRLSDRARREIVQRWLAEQKAAKRQSGRKAAKRQPGRKGARR